MFKKDSIKKISKRTTTDYFYIETLILKIKLQFFYQVKQGGFPIEIKRHIL